MGEKYLGRCVGLMVERVLKKRPLRGGFFIGQIDNSQALAPFAGHIYGPRAAPTLEFHLAVCNDTDLTLPRGRGFSPGRIPASINADRRSASLHSASLRLSHNALRANVRIRCRFSVRRVYVASVELKRYAPRGVMPSVQTEACSAAIAARQRSPVVNRS